LVQCNSFHWDKRLIAVRRSALNRLL